MNPLAAILMVLTMIFTPFWVYLALDARNPRSRARAAALAAVFFLAFLAVTR